MLKDKVVEDKLGSRDASSFRLLLGRAGFYSIYQYTIRRPCRDTYAYFEKVIKAGHGFGSLTVEAARSVKIER